VARDGRPVLVTGSPGGRTIINTVLQVVLNVCEHQMSAAEAVVAPRWHHQWFPDVARLEQAGRAERTPLLDELRHRGHRVEVQTEPQGDAHTIWVAPSGELHGVADHRISGHAAGL
jgi:gamma-glutamyltranspeptidase/glutathione hydrolase